MVVARHGWHHGGRYRRGYSGSRHEQRYENEEAKNERAFNLEKSTPCLFPIAYWQLAIGY